jgi:hypothetical protein
VPAELQTDCDGWQESTVLCGYASRRLLKPTMTTHEMFDVYDNGKREENEQDEMRDYE